MVTVNSVWRIVTDPDFFVMDEPNTCLAAIAGFSPKQRPLAILNKILHWLRVSQFFLLPDAYAGERVRVLLGDAGRAAHWLLVDYKRHRGRKVKLLFSQPEACFDKTIQAVASGQRVAMACTSVVDALGAHRELTKRCPGIDVLVLHGDLPQAEKTRILKLLEEGRELPQVFIWTNTLGVGNNFSMPHFDVCFARLDWRTLTAEDVVQLISRFRVYISDTVILCFALGTHDTELPRWRTERVEPGEVEDTVPPLEQPGLTSRKAAANFLRFSYRGDESSFVLRIPDRWFLWHCTDRGAWKREPLDAPPEEDVGEEEMLAALTKHGAESELQERGAGAATGAFYQRKPGATWLLTRKGVAPAYTWEEAEQEVSFKLSLQAAIVHGDARRRPPRPGETADAATLHLASNSAWSAAARGPAAGEEIAMISPEGKAYRNQLILTRIDSQNRYFSFVPELRGLFEQMGCEVTEEHLNTQQEEKRPQGIQASKAAVRKEKKKKKADAVAPEEPTAADEERVAALVARTEPLNRAERLLVARMRILKRFGPEVGGDGVQRYNMADEKVRRALLKPPNQELFGVWCQLAEAELGQRTLKEVLADLIAATGTQNPETALVVGGPQRWWSLRNAIELLESVLPPGVPLKGITSPSLAELTYDGLPKVTAATRKLLDERRCRPPAPPRAGQAQQPPPQNKKEQAITELKSVLREQLGVEVYNAHPVHGKRGFRTDAPNTNTTAFRRISKIFPEPSFELYQNYPSWLTPAVGTQGGAAPT